MNCPHGVEEHAKCHERACVQNVFAMTDDAGVVYVAQVFCDSCRHGMGVRKKYRHGLSARSLRDFVAKHGAHKMRWEAIEVDTRLELSGRGVPPVRVDSERKIDQLTIPST